MKKKTIIFIIFVILGVFSFALQMVKAESLDKCVKLNTSNEMVEIGESFTISIHAQNFKLVACNFKLYFDETKVEVVTKSENMNVVDGGIAYTWFDEQGGQNAKENEEIVQFEFKAKENGIVYFDMQGEFYNANQETEKVNVQPVEVKIGKRDSNEELGAQSLNESNNDNKNEETMTQESNSSSKNEVAMPEESISVNEINAKILSENNNDDANNTNLAILRLNHEGITPTFKKDIKEYYMLVDENINELEVTAFPENTNSKVTISGNKNLQNGVNSIVINVTSENGNSEAEYKIYVTKTENKQTANTNLENLAIENAILEPTFWEGETNYKVSVNSDVEQINILAVPQNKDATVNIVGNTNLKQGDNEVIVSVTATNGVTFKNYRINVYRKSKLEMEAEEKSQEEQSDLLDNTQEIEGIDNSREMETREQEEQSKETKNGLWLIWCSIVIIAVIGIGGIVMVKKGKA